MATSDTAHHLRLHVVSAASQRIIEGRPGIHCVGFPAADGNPALVVVWDEDDNEGASATNSIEAVLLHLRERWSSVVPVEEALVVERDSGGDFDHAYPDWSGTMPTRAGAPVVKWLPLRWPGASPRSVAAFKAMFGKRAAHTLEVVAGAPA